MRFPKIPLDRNFFAPDGFPDQNPRMTEVGCKY